MNIEISWKCSHENISYYTLQYIHTTLFFILFFYVYHTQIDTETSDWKHLCRHSKYDCLLDAFFFKSPFQKKKAIVIIMTMFYEDDNKVSITTIQKFSTCLPPATLNATRHDWKFGKLNHEQNVSIQHNDTTTSPNSYNHLLQQLSTLQPPNIPTSTAISTSFDYCHLPARIFNNPPQKLQPQPQPKTPPSQQLFTITSTYNQTTKHQPTYLHTYIHTYLHTYRQTDIQTYMQTYIHTYLPTYLLAYLVTYQVAYPPTCPPACWVDSTVYCTSRQEPKMQIPSILEDGASISYQPASAHNHTTAHAVADTTTRWSLLATRTLTRKQREWKEGRKRRTTE